MSKAIKVLQIIDSLAVGGAEMMAVNIANGLVNKVESHLCVTRSEGLLKEKIQKRVGYIFLNKQSVFDFKAVFLLIRYIKKNRIEIVHAHSSSFFTSLLVKFINPRIKIVWHDHYGKAEELEERKVLFLKFASFFFNSIISVNQLLLDWSKKELYCKDVQFIANFATFVKINNVTVLKGESDKRIICTAAFRPQKDHTNLINAFNIINSKYPSWTLHLIGKIHNDNYSNTVKKTIKNKALEDKVFLYDACLDIENILKQADIGVLSSNSEGLPVSLLEYGLVGLPVIVTDVGECKKVINDNGIVVNKEDAIDLSNAILKYIEDDKLRDLKAIQFHNHIVENYSENSYLSKLLNIYKSC